MNQHAVIVTGGSTGIGAAICRCFLEADYQVFNLSRRPAEIDDARLQNVAVDLSDREATRRTALDICERAGVDTLVHNAGLIREARLEDTRVEDLDYLAEVHLASGITLLQACLPHMKSRGYGRVVLVSTRAVQGMPGRTNYSATKAGMIAQARTWAMELGEFGITVNAVAPGPIEDTEMFESVFEEGDPRIATIAEGLPLRRLGKSEDVARAVMFLAAAENTFITGQNLFVCGGASLGGLSLS